MWDYQEFDQVIDGVSGRMFTNHGAEKYVPSEECLLHGGEMAFQFGQLFELSVRAEDDNRFIQLHGYSSARPLEPDECSSNDDCQYCEVRSATMTTINLKYHDNTEFCTACYKDITSMMLTQHTNTEPKSLGFEYYIYASESCDVQVFHYTELPCCSDDKVLYPYLTEIHGCDRASGDDYHTQHDYCCVLSRYIPFVYRAAYMKWLCERALDVLECMVDVKPAIIVYVLSGTGNIWNRVSPSSDSVTSS